MADRSILTHIESINENITIDDLSEDDVMKVLNIYCINGFPVRDEETGRWMLVDDDLDDDFDQFEYDLTGFDEIDY